MKVLVVEDGRTARKMLKSAVERLGHECLTAADGTEAWALFRAEGDGSAMVGAEVMRFRDQCGCANVVQPGVGYLTFARLADTYPVWSIPQAVSFNDPAVSRMPACLPSDAQPRQLADRSLWRARVDCG